ncbi:dihydropteroate synthase [Brevirhabdus pacifica]|uniref:Dihydropteroate synthase n=1 Tax=Brevirhabdus pacifica TaxID=1267768 RepID=A0A1U7DH44_9RHOB|nr:dihydropteroate synthase [Brevirhabdus pacifica]APX89296.1 dihydropteroate synthase [Brevirhabdus pacifica]OWU76669.1 dihydropteroate synthase [Loktanella sp. 22II-4b]PJJ86087.1 dihydropteroate synthase [Brevirhabdus pacifica]
MSTYYRPLAQTDPCRPSSALPVAGGWSWFKTVEVMERGRRGHRLPVGEVPSDILDRLTGARPPIAGMQWGQPHVMGILNVTPDSFSDGGDFDAPDAALAQARAIAEAGADILDIGGESTRPGAETVPDKTEIARTAPLIRALRGGGVTLPISIDTRKAPVAEAALEAGADLINDVSALSHDPALATLAAREGAPVCLMHAQGDPAVMQDDPRYDDVLFDVYDHLSARVDAAVAAGIRRERIIVDPGIGFGKTKEHNLRLLTHLSLFHGLGCPVLLGVSRKRFIGTIGRAPEARDRLPGSLAVALHGIMQGVQIVRVHDTPQTIQAIRLWQALGATID